MFPFAWFIFLLSYFVIAQEASGPGWSIPSSALERGLCPAGPFWGPSSEGPWGLGRCAIHMVVLLTLSSLLWPYCSHCGPAVVLLSTLFVYFLGPAVGGLSSGCEEDSISKSHQGINRATAPPPRDNRATPRDNKVTAPHI